MNVRSFRSEPNILASQSTPAESTLMVFAYHNFPITNLRIRVSQIANTHWDNHRMGNEQVQEVKGSGVIGEYPHFRTW